MRDYLAVPIQDHRVRDVGLAGEADDVLLERGEVVEEEGGRRDPGQPLGHRGAPAVDLLDDRRPLPVLHHGGHGGHERRDDEDRPDEELRAERDEDRSTHEPSDQRGGCSSQTFRNGMYASPRPLTSTPFTYGWNSRSYVWCQTGMTAASSMTSSSARR